MDESRVLTRELISIIRAHFTLDWGGIHGAPHWARVRENGLRLSELTGARTEVVELFAFLHDSCRQNDGRDRDHGKRAADFVLNLQGKFFDLNPDCLDLLIAACHSHSDGLIDANITVQTCWDADRLDLGRIGIRPDPTKLCTVAARDSKMIENAYRNSIG